jgi:N-acetylmuramic acid-specific PTS system IIC component
MFGTLTNGPGAPFGDALLAALFIFAVLFGIHQGFIPIYIALMNTPPHINTLFPILTLGGATQVGGAICLYLLGKKNGTLRKQVVGPIITGFLGIGEPILYGISLPRIVPLVASAIAATIPGFLAGAINT